MSLKLQKIIELMEAFAPVELKESYDNVGLMVGDKDRDVTRILLALDCTLEVIEEAVNKGVELIITHHPLLFRKPSSITTDTLQGKKIIKLITSNISLYSCHTNLDSVEDGMTDTFMELIKAEEVRVLEKNKILVNGKHGIGRIGNIEPIALKEFIKDIKKIFNVNFVKYAGDDNKIISKVAVINGSGENYLELANNYGVDCVITGDTTYHYISDYSELGLSIIDLGHFASEWLVFLRLMNNIKDKYPELKDIQLIPSESSRDPYKFL